MTALYDFYPRKIFAGLTSAFMQKIYCEKIFAGVFLRGYGDFLLQKNFRRVSLRGGHDRVADDPHADGAGGGGGGLHHFTFSAPHSPVSGLAVMERQSV